MTNTTGFYVSSDRISKAKKITKILEEERHSNLEQCSILDIGTGNGEIANFLSSQCSNLISIDIEDNRTNKSNFIFLVSNESLPFKDNSFDIVISNHVIEHVTNNKLHLNEIYRVLKKNGIMYLATPNRLWPWEVHYKLPLLHYLPNSIFIYILKKTGKYHENLNLLYWWDIKKLTKTRFKLKPYCDKVLKHPEKYYLNTNKLIKYILNHIPLKIYTLSLFINPTFIFVLKKYKKTGKNIE